ncbi:hypothetical protein BN14_11823 [Rhizoctonia solani AG-1 IB]|uniref:CHAT domain-containing protein n=1 Tax=Thanatephorus cucumeris (strain AG1-IB / isolate 7/3/14) TaxID=1108050 RepID=M5CEP4_THACB|nr:hypothetical protein BN14_11823 [Rhizoctonia solani AG-1 IB]
MESTEPPVHVYCQTDDLDLEELHRRGETHNSQFKRFGKLKDLQEAIEYGRRALDPTPKGHPEEPRQLTSLGTYSLDRFRRLGDLEDMNQSMDYLVRAVELTAENDSNLAFRLGKLGWTYIDRFRRLGAANDVEESIEMFSRALELTPDGHPDLPSRHANLGVSYSDRYRQLGAIDDLQKSIECFSCALDVTPDGHPHLPSRHADLGVSYSDRYQRLGAIDDLENSIKCFSRALDLTPHAHPDLSLRYSNLAISYHHQYRRTKDPSHLASSLDLFRKSSHLINGAPRDVFTSSLDWANLASEYTYLNPIKAFCAAVDLLPHFIWLGATTAQRYQDLALADNLALRAASAAIQSSSYDLALEWLEHARCVVLLLGFITDTPEHRHRLAREYENLLVEVRSLPKFEEFLRPTKVQGLKRAARHGPIVVINCHEAQCDALLVLPSHNHIAHIALPEFTEDKARHARSEIEKLLDKKRLRERGVTLKGGRQEEPDPDIGLVLAELWNNVVKPVLDYLGYINNEPTDNLPHITWCPTGALTFLPLHAAGDYEQPKCRVFNHVISSYTPTLSALLASTPTELSRTPRVLAIREAPTFGPGQLPGTAKELEHIGTHTKDKAEYKQLISRGATPAAVLDAMEQHDWVHLACHAKQNIRDPTKSGFFLHGGTLDLAAITQRSFRNKGLAFLSACQTATGDEKLPDEAIHLASGMLMAGYPSVIATMWSVDDSDAPFVADQVYAQLVKDGKVGNGEAGRALHHAVAGLREKVGLKEFGRWASYIHIDS